MTVSTVDALTTWTDDATDRTWTVNGAAVVLVQWEELAGYIRVTRIL